MTARYFVDSNVLIYARDLSEPAKQERSALWLNRLWSARAGRLSYQVLAECYAVLTSPKKLRMDDSTARTYVRSFVPWNPIVADGALMETAWQAQDRYGFAWWDCLIVAAAAAAGCTHILTEDLQHGQSLDGISVVSPFKVSPEDDP